MPVGPRTQRRIQLLPGLAAGEVKALFGGAGCLETLRRAAAARQAAAAATLTAAG